MGGKNGKAGIFITSESRNISIGSTITGTIYVNIETQLKSPKLLFRFVGKELYTGGVRSLKRRICNKQIVLHEWPRRAEPKHYMFPFNFTLPDNIPASFAHEETASITYWVRAVLVENNTLKVASDSIEIHVLPLYNSIACSMLQNQSIPVKTLMCLYRGNISIGAYTNKDVFYPDENGSLTIEIDNSRNGASVNSVTVQLVRALTIKNVSAGIKCDILYTTKFKRKIPSGTSLFSDQALNVNIPFYTFKDKIRCAGTTRGQIIHCKYLIRARVNFGILTPSKSLYIDVQIYPENLLLKAPIQCPPGWNPQVMDMNICSFVEAEEYKPSAPDFESF